MLLVRSLSLTLVLAASVLAAGAAPAVEDRERERRHPASFRPWRDDPSIVPREAILAEKLAAGTRGAVGSAGRAGAAGISAPTETVQFDAIPKIADTTPGDPHGAKGADAIVTVVNVHYAVWTPSGTALVGPSSLVGLFGGVVPSGTRVFDPKVVYDAREGRFYLVVLGLSQEPLDSHVLVASFTDAQATAPLTWCRVALPGDPVPGNGNLIADYPGVGFDDARLYVSTNQFTDREAFRYAQVLAVDRADLGSGCSGSPDFRKFWDLREPDGDRAFTVQPAVSVGPDPAPKGWGLSFDWDCSPCRGSEVTLWQWRRRDGRLTQRTRTLGVGRARIAPLGRQRGGGGLDARWDTGDLRLVSAFFDTDRRILYAAHSVARDLGTDVPLESVVRWYEIGVGGRLRAAGVRRKGIVGAPDTDAAWPALATNARGRLFLTYSRAAPDEFLSAWAATIARRGSAPSVLLLRRGNARYEATPAFGTSGVERWGDYNAITREPGGAGLLMWTVNQYARDDGSSANGTRSELWQQVVNAVHA